MARRVRGKSVLMLGNITRSFAAVEWFSTASMAFSSSTSSMPKFVVFLFGAGMFWHFLSNIKMDDDYKFPLFLPQRKSMNSVALEEIRVVRSRNTGKLQLIGAVFRLWSQFSPNYPEGLDSTSWGSDGCSWGGGEPDGTRCSSKLVCELCSSAKVWVCLQRHQLDCGRHAA